MSIYESMRTEADVNFAGIDDLPRYPAKQREWELQFDPGYYGRVLVAYGVLLGDGQPDFRRVPDRRYLSGNVLLMGIVESRVIEGDEEAVRAHPVAAQGFETDPAQFDTIAEEATSWVYRPTGQFVGVRSNNVPSLQSTEPRFDPDDVDPTGEGAGKYVDMPEVDATISRQLGVAPWTGNVVVPALVAVGTSHVELGHGVISTRKIELAWYYNPSGEEPVIPQRRIA